MRCALHGNGTSWWSNPEALSALAALLSGKVAPLDDTVVVLSGGNIDPALHARIVGGA